VAAREAECLRSAASGVDSPTPFRGLGSALLRNAQILPATFMSSRSPLNCARSDLTILNSPSSRSSAT
jgi:hypothetical protein